MLLVAINSSKSAGLIFKCQTFVLVKNTASIIAESHLISKVLFCIIKIMMPKNKDNHRMEASYV